MSAVLIIPVTNPRLLVTGAKNGETCVTCRLGAAVVFLAGPTVCRCCSCEGLPGRPPHMPPGAHCPRACGCWLEQATRQVPACGAHVRIVYAELDAERRPTP